MSRRSGEINGWETEMSNKYKYYNPPPKFNLKMTIFYMDKKSGVVNKRQHPGERGVAA
jgi:hypothetical protein